VLCNGAIVWRDGKQGAGRNGRALLRQEMQKEAKA
jgi:N-acyl-D-amino-acid deacylase